MVDGTNQESLPLVSVIVPYYRKPLSWTIAALDSLAAQEYPNNRYEIILVDDCSEAGPIDALEGVLKAIQADNGPETHYLRLGANNGPSGARNTGAHMAAGSHLFFVDADDIVKPFALRTCAEVSDGAALVFSDHQKVSTDLDEVIHVRNKALFHKLHKKWKNTLFDPLLHCSYVGMCQLVDRDAFLSIGGYRSQLRVGEDFDMLLRLTELSREVNLVHVPVVCYDYRSHNGSISNSGQFAHDPITAVSDALERRGYHRFSAVPSSKLRPFDNSFFDVAEQEKLVPMPYIDYDAYALKTSEEDS